MAQGFLSVSSCVGAWNWHSYSVDSYSVGYSSPLQISQMGDGNRHESQQ